MVCRLKSPFCWSNLNLSIDSPGILGNDSGQVWSASSTPRGAWAPGGSVAPAGSCGHGGMKIQHMLDLFFGWFTYSFTYSLTCCFFFEPSFATNARLQSCVVNFNIWGDIRVSLKWDVAITGRNLFNIRILIFNIAIHGRGPTKLRFQDLDVQYIAQIHRSEQGQLPHTSMGLARYLLQEDSGRDARWSMAEDDGACGSCGLFGICTDLWTKLKIHRKVSSTRESIVPPSHFTDPPGHQGTGTMPGSERME